MIDRIHRVRTPEGITLPFRVAPAGERLQAFLIDLLILAAGMSAFRLLAFLALPSDAAELGQGLALLAGLLLWNVYFISWEINRGGVTIGKRIAGLRVISRDGGPLTPEAVFARNLTRDVELFLPLSALLVPESMLPGLPRWAATLGCVWLFAFAVLPLCNKDRLRCGDLVAGTLVVKVPAPVLLRDLAATAGSAYAYPFTRDQLDHYGIQELQVLEDVLRRFDQGLVEPGTLEDVCRRIQKKIDWRVSAGRVRPLDFLEAFYAAQRGRLEQKLLAGRRQEQKRR